MDLSNELRGELDRQHILQELLPSTTTAAPPSKTSAVNPPTSSNRYPRSTARANKGGTNNDLMYTRESLSGSEDLNLRGAPDATGEARHVRSAVTTTSEGAFVKGTHNPNPRPSTHAGSSSSDNSVVVSEDGRQDRAEDARAHSISPVRNRPGAGSNSARETNSQKERLREMQRKRLEAAAKPKVRNFNVVDDNEWMQHGPKVVPR